MSGQISGTWIKVGVSLISGLGVICVTLLIFIWQGQITATEKLDIAITLVEGRVGQLEVHSSASATNIEYIQLDIRGLKIDVRELLLLRGAP